MPLRLSLLCCYLPDFRHRCSVLKCVTPTGATACKASAVLSASWYAGCKRSDEMAQQASKLSCMQTPLQPWSSALTLARAYLSTRGQAHCADKHVLATHICQGQHIPARQEACQITTAAQSACTLTAQHMAGSIKVHACCSRWCPTPAGGAPPERRRSKVPSLRRTSRATSGALGCPWLPKLPMIRVSYRRTSTLSTRSQKRSSTNQQPGITRTYTHVKAHAQMPDPHHTSDFCNMTLLRSFRFQLALCWAQETAAGMRKSGAAYSA